MASTDPAHTDASSAALIPLGSHANAAPIELKRPVTLIGSRKDVVRLHLQSGTVSKAHCAIILNAWGCYVHDLSSRTGTMVNGKPVVDQDLADGDVIQVGRFQFKYRAPKKTRPKPIPLPTAELSVSTLTGPLTVHKRVLVIGRRAGADVQFEDSRVSNIHALIIEQDGRRLVRDLGSRSGTWLDDQPVHQEPFPDGADLKIGGATLRIADRPAPTARSADAPLTLADAAPTAAVGLDAIDLSPLHLEPLDDDLALDDQHGGFRPDDTLPAAEDDDLAALRRNWKSPARPPEPVIEAPRPVKPAKPVELEPLQVEAEAPDLEPLELELEPDDVVAEAAKVEAPTFKAPAAEPILTPPAKAPAEPVVAPAAETPAVATAPITPIVPAAEPIAEVAAPEVVHAAPAEPVEIDLAKAEAAERLAEAEADADDLDVVEPLSLEPLELDALDLDDLSLDTPTLELPKAEARVAEEAPTAEIAEPVAETAAPAVEAPAEPIAEVEEALELDELPAEPDDLGALDELTVDPDGPPVDIEALAAEALAEKPVAEVTPVIEVPAGPTVEAVEAEVAANELDEPALEGLELDLDAPAPRADAILAAKEESLDHARLDPDAPATAIEAGEAALPPELAVPTAKADALETAEAESTEQAEAELEPLDLEPLDLGDLSLELDTEAPAPIAESLAPVAPVDADALTLDPEAPAVAETAAGTEASAESPEKSGD